MGPRRQHPYRGAPQSGLTFGNTGGVMATKVTVKGQVSLPKRVRDAAGIKPGDKVDVHATASGAVLIEKPRADDYVTRLYALAKRKLAHGFTTDELMRMTHGDTARDPKPSQK